MAYWYCGCKGCIEITENNHKQNRGNGKDKSTVAFPVHKYAAAAVKKGKIMYQDKSQKRKRPVLTFKMWDDTLGIRANFDCTITVVGEEKRFQWQCREQPRFMLDGGRGGKEEAKFSALHFFRGNQGFWASWA